MALIGNAQLYVSRLLSQGRLYLKAASGERVQVESDLAHSGAKLGLYGATPVTKPTVSGSTGGVPALDSLLAALASQGVIVNSSSSGGTSAPAPANVAPSITFAAVSGATAGTAFTLSGTASDSDGSISKVEVFRSGVSLGLATLSGGNWSKSVTESAAATVSYSATATDNSGATASASRSVVVGTASSGTALSAGSIAVGTVTDTSIQVLNSASATGGTGTITYQHHQSTSPIPNPPTSATAIAGATTAAYTHSGLAASTTYYFKRVASDGSTTATTAQVSAATSAATVTLTGVNDLFDDANGALLQNHARNDGGSWIKHPLTTGTGLQISGGELLTVDTVSGERLYYSANTTPNDVDITTNIKFLAVKGFNGMVWRMSTTAKSGYFAHLNHFATGGPAWALIRFDAGGEVGIAPNYVPPALPTAGQIVTMRATMVGSTINVYLDGVLRLTTTDTTYASGRVGLTGSVNATATGGSHILDIKTA